MTSSDQEDEDIKTAIALSLAECGASSPGLHPTTSPQLKNESEDQNASATSGNTMLGLDRKAMEAQRLARLKRKLERPISPPEGRGSRKAPKLTEETITFSSGARLNMISTLIDQDQQSRKSPVANAANERMKREPSTDDVKIKVEPDTATTSGNSREGTLKYPAGVIKKTWAFGHARTGNDVKLEEVLEPLTLKTAVLSAFQWDTNWLLSKLKIPPNGGSTKCIFVMQAKEAAQREEMLETAKEMRSFLRLCFPPMEGQIHCMHSKLMLLFHPDKLRVAIPTANLLNFDWGETGLMENSVFMIDLPRHNDSSKPNPADMPFFEKELLFFLEKQGLDADVRKGVLNFDFSATTNMAFVHTIGGTSFDQAAHRTGLPGLSRAVQALNLHTDRLEIDFAASSIGSLNDAFLTNVHSAARGQNPIPQAATTATTASHARSSFFTPGASSASSRQGRGSSSNNNSNNSGSGAISIREQMRIYFPTRETVAASTAGAAGTICLSRNWFEAGGFPRSCFRDYRSTRAGLLSHNKILCARGKRGAMQPGAAAEEDVAWVYVGSANMSESAWGKVSVNKKKGDTRVNCRNWECGVLLPVPVGALKSKREETENVVVKKEKIEGEDSETESEPEDATTGNGSGQGLDGELVSMDVFKTVLDLPFHVPGERYGRREPWYFKEQM